MIIIIFIRLNRPWYLAPKGSEIIKSGDVISRYFSGGLHARAQQSWPWLIKHTALSS